MANVLKKDKQLSILRCLLEGNSIRGTERITGVHRDTIMRTLVRFGNQCEQWQDAMLTNLPLRHVEVDEIWTFVGKKDKKLNHHEKRKGELGSQYLFLALDQDSRLIVSHKIGKRDSSTTFEFIEDLEKRMFRAPDRQSDHRPQISSDGWKSYYPAIGQTFDGTVRHGVVIKNYANPEVGRYAPPDLTAARRFSINGIKELASICTSHIERFNLSIRTFMKRFTRLAVGFSKKLDNLKASVSLFVAYYNFCWRTREKGKSGQYRPTAAMACGITETLWSLENLFDEVTAYAKREKQIARYKKLADKLAGQD